jgi:hypothetical protein
MPDVTYHAPLPWLIIRLVLHQLRCLFINDAAWADSDHLYFLRRYAINNPEFAYPEASITFQLPLKRFPVPGLRAHLIECLMNSFLQCRMEGPDVCRDVFCGADRTEAHQRGSSFQSSDVSDPMIHFPFFLNVFYAAVNFPREFPV